jgi:hypothetical protein
VGVYALRHGEADPLVIGTRLSVAERAYAVDVCGKYDLQDVRGSEVAMGKSVTL